MKMVTDVCDGGGTVEVDPDRPAIRFPEGYQKNTDPRLVAPITLRAGTRSQRPAPRGGAPIRALERASIASNGAGARVGIASAGKAYYDLMQALRDLGIARTGIADRIAKSA